MSSGTTANTSAVAGATTAATSASMTTGTALGSNFNVNATSGTTTATNSNVLQPSARSALVELVQDHLGGIIRDALTVQRHSKRARYTAEGWLSRRIHAGDINTALSWNGCEKLYATAVMATDPEVARQRVSLADVLRYTELPPAPREVRYCSTWIAVNGRAQSTLTLPGGDTDSDAFAARNRTTTVIMMDNQGDDLGDDDEFGNSETAMLAPGTSTRTAGDPFLRVQQLQKSILSEELQLYYRRVTFAMERGNATPTTRQQQDRILHSLQIDPGLQELVPFLIRYCQKELYRPTSDARTLVRLAAAILLNPHLHVELHLHELLPALMTCTVARQLTASNHWILRREAGYVLYLACQLYGTEYATLKSRVVKALCEALQSPSWASRYGGMVTIALFGPRAIDAFLLPSILELWQAALAWEGINEESISTPTPASVQNEPSTAKSTTGTEPQLLATAAAATTTTTTTTVVTAAPTMMETTNTETQETAATTMDKSTVDDPPPDSTAVASAAPAFVPAAAATNTTTGQSTTPMTTTQSTMNRPTHEQMAWCQQASLDALAIFLRRVEPSEKAARISRQDLEQVLGDRLITLEEGCSEYVTCFI